MDGTERRVSRRSGTRRINRLRALRTAKEMSLAQVGEMTDQSFVTVLRQETGERGMSPEIIRKYAEIFGVQPDELFIESA